MPRGPELVPLLLARDHGEAYDAAEFDRVVQAAVDDAVVRQVAAGVSIVSDGELGKVGYSTYVIERLEGFGGHSPRKPALDLAQVPELAQKLSHIMGAQEFTRASAIAPVRLVDLQPLHDDIRRFKAAMGRHGNGVRGFMNSASPGLITAFQPNQYYPDHEAYLADLVDAMRPEYEAIVEAGFDLQLDCPDLAMSRHTGYQDLTDTEFLKVAAANVEALNAATANIPPERLRMHVCWGNYEGPHDFDIPLEKIIDIVLAARPQTILFEGANPRHEHEWIVWKAADLADKILAPGLVDSCSNYLETAELIAQRLERFATFVGKDRLIASTDCGFGTFAGYGKIDPSVAWKKLAVLREGADLADRRIR
ncbi:MAG: cobalamin-independent methionine synthase II family protein [Novosphingobium sp.]|nr:cobalamin-independent methionine synthase II family protein [Novosphingobium sp.]